MDFHALEIKYSFLLVLVCYGLFHSVFCCRQRLSVNKVRRQPPVTRPRSDENKAINDKCQGTYTLIWCDIVWQWPKVVAECRMQDQVRKHQFWPNANVVITFGVQQ